MEMPPPPPISHSRLEEGLRPGGPGGPGGPNGPGGPPGPPEEPEDSVSRYIVCMNVINTTTHLLLGAVVFFAFVCINVSSFIINDVTRLDMSKFSAHVYLTVIGYMLLMSQAILSLNPRTGWTKNFKYTQKSRLYWSLQVLGSTMAVIGCIMGIVAVEEFTDVTLPANFPEINIGHQETAHHVVGLIAMILTTISLVGGLVQLFCTKNKMVNSSLSKALYSLVATVTLIIAFVAICLAFEEFRVLLYNGNTNMGITFAVLVILGLVMMIIGNITVGGRVII